MPGQLRAPLSLPPWRCTFGQSNCEGVHHGHSRRNLSRCDSSEHPVMLRQPVEQVALVGIGGEVRIPRFVPGASPSDSACLSPRPLILRI